LKTLDRPEDRAEILFRLRRVRPDSPRRWGRMSAPQMVCHLADAFRVLTGELTVCGASGVLQRTLLKRAVLYLPVRWPRGIPTDPGLDQERSGTRSAGFAADRERLEALVEAVVAPAWSFTPRPHPLFGVMTRAEWLRWGWLHMDHHLRQFGA
jgi:hypothetical protein